MDDEKPRKIGNDRGRNLDLSERATVNMVVLVLPISFSNLCASLLKGLGVAFCDGQQIEIQDVWNALWCQRVISGVSCDSPQEPQIHKQERAVPRLWRPDARPRSRRNAQGQQDDT